MEISSFSTKLFAFFIGIIIFTILYVKNKLNYWKNRNVPYINLLVLKDVTRVLTKPYYEFKAKGHKYFGTLSLGQPVFVPIDLTLIKHVMAIDFQYFNTHGAHVDEKDDPLGAHLFNLSGDKWKKLRIKLTPTFTSGKMKMMFQTLSDCTKVMENYLVKNIDKEKCMNIKELCGCFTTDVIGSVAFGLDCNSFDENESEFRIYGKKLFESSFKQYFKRAFATIFPYISRLLHIKKRQEDVNNFFTKVVKDIVNYRENNNYRRMDFMQLLIDLKNNNLKKENSDETNHNHEPLTLNEISAQAFLFFIAGFETSSTTMSFCLYELARNQDIQEKVRNEIRKVLSENDGKLTYESINEMKYLGLVVEETMRKYPSSPTLIRKCLKDYKVPNSNLIIEKGVTIIIPLYQIHHNPEYFPDPEIFDPERFSTTNKAKIPSFAYLPFGEGPRICIGQRFGMMQVKGGLITLINKFRFTLNEKTAEKLYFDPVALVLASKEIIYLNMIKIED